MRVYREIESGTVFSDSECASREMTESVYSSSSSFFFFLQCISERKDFVVVFVVACDGNCGSGSVKHR